MEVMGRRASAPAAPIQAHIDAAVAAAMQHERAEMQRELAEMQQERAEMQARIDAAIAVAMQRVLADVSAVHGASSLGSSRV